MYYHEYEKFCAIETTWSWYNTRINKLILYLLGKRPFHHQEQLRRSFCQ